MKRYELTAYDRMSQSEFEREDSDTNRHYAMDRCLDRLDTRGFNYFGYDKKTKKKKIEKYEDLNNVCTQAQMAYYELLERVFKSNPKFLKQHELERYLCHTSLREFYHDKYLLKAIEGGRPA